MGVTENMLSNTTTQECVRHSEFPGQDIYDWIIHYIRSTLTSLKCQSTGSEMFDTRFCNHEACVRSGYEYDR